MPISLLTVALRHEQDILLVRQRARVIAQAAGFSGSDITRITTALSEIARNALEYAGKGSVAFSIEPATDGQDLVMRIADEGAGIANLAEVLAPDFKSRTGMGIGIKGSRALMDRFVITSEVGRGTTVVMAKRLPWSSKRFGPADAAQLAQTLAKVADSTPFGELQLENQALLNTLQELTARQAEIERLGVVANQARQDAEASQLVAEHAVVVRQRFMALTTHELRSPLNAIVGYLELLDMELADSISEKQKSYFTRVQRAARHLVGVTNDFLDMAKGDAGRLHVVRTEESARDVMIEAAGLVAPQASARNVTVELSDTRQHITYLGDRARVRQILLNLLGNAVSFTPPGGSVRMIASAEPQAGFHDAPEGAWCAIRVIDNGPGIPADKLAHVFEPFVQLTENGQATRQGSGLGLTVSRQLAVLMGGDLTAESSDSGAVFTLWMAAPACTAACTSASEQIEEATPARQ
ncbi:MAG TPA: sensor histidine kinase [Gemmatimonadaceae bacterium]|nr:sensor histidine kinase [Gemmatimonadaceae bacterium]